MAKVVRRRDAVRALELGQVGGPLERGALVAKVLIGRDALGGAKLLLGRVRVFVIASSAG